MRGAIHGIWLITPGGHLHPAVTKNLTSWVPAATAADFQVALWTNISELPPEDLLRLKAANIKVVDPIECQNSPLYKYYEFFFAKGLNGDTTAFALASDILRMAILDFTANDKYFIYVDPNDVKLLNLEVNLNTIDLVMQNNKLGFAFPVGPVADTTAMFDIRNDVLVALKANNPKFFESYLTAYWSNLEDTYKRYEKPSTDTQAKLFANRISNGTSTLFFRLEAADDKSVKVLTQFAKYSTQWQPINSGIYLNYTREVEHGNTWLPVGAPHNAQEELVINDLFLKGLSEEQKTAKLQTSFKQFYSEIIGANTYTIVASISTCLGVLLIIMVSYKLIMAKSAKAI